MERYLNSKKLISLLLAASLLPIAGLTGCGAVDEDNEVVELLDPVSVAETNVAASYRNLYSSTTYASVVSPKITEYSFSTYTTFTSYNKAPGDEVKPGDVIIYGDTVGIDKQIEGMQDSIKSMEEAHTKSVKSLEKSIADAQATYDTMSEIIDNLNAQKPEQYTTDENGNQVETKEYQDWLIQFNRYDGEYRSAFISLSKLQLSLKENNELYDLDHNYQLANLTRVKNQRNDYLLSSDMEGTVVAVRPYSGGNYLSYVVSLSENINKDATAAAVGDLSVKELKCDFLNQGVIKSAYDYYAVINGERYEIEYQAIDSDEYDRLKAKNDVVYTTFTIDDPENKVNLGDFAVIVLVDMHLDNVLCVPKDAIGANENGKYVYVYDGKDYETRPIRTGKSDGSYTEILSGLDEGELVKSSLTIIPGENRATVEYGSVSGTFSNTGYLFYPNAAWINNPVEYGTIYLDEICVSRYETVTKGQVLARIHVVPDNIEIDRQQRNLDREKERLQDFLDENKDTDKDDQYYKDTLEAKNERIADLEELISKMKRDSYTTEIISDKDGIVAGIISSEPGNLLGAGSRVAQIADESECFILVEDNEGRLAYGNTVSIGYKDDAGKAQTMEGTVVTVNNKSLSKDINIGYDMVSVAPEMIPYLVSSNNRDGWTGISRFSVTATIRSMENVLIVPKKAVKDVSGTTYVTVINEKGEVERVSFVAGGSDSVNYWIAEGLTEGMTICLE